MNKERILNKYQFRDVTWEHVYEFINDMKIKRIQTPKNLNEFQISDQQLDQLYATYPRKVGKTRGMVQLKKLITSQILYDQVSTALKRYREWCIKEGKEARYIMHFSTWVSTWREWLDNETGTSNIDQAPDKVNWDLIDELKKQCKESGV